MLTYMEVHLYYTLPPIIVLYLIARPLISTFDRIKIITICALALIYTTPWDNYIIYHKAWWYRKDAVIGTIGYVPIEEYMFFIIQTIFTSLWTICCSRWTLQSLYLRNKESSKFQLIKHVGCLLILSIILWAWFNATPATKLFYLCTITWWALLIVVILWYIASSFVVQCYQQILCSVVFPSFYLCYVDVIALRAKVWHINESTSLEIFVVDELPLEEVVFFFITNFLVVIGAAAFDQANAVINTYFRESIQPNSKEGYFSKLESLLTATIYHQQKLDDTIIDDLAACVDILNEGSKTFSVAANCFPNAVRQDLTTLYAFCRVTDDMVDNEHSMELKTHRLKVIEEFLDQLFANRVNVYNYTWKVTSNSEPSIDWNYFRKQLTDKQLRSFRGIARISFYLPQEPFYELVKGYKWDIDGRMTHSENDLIEYSKYVASSVATLCTFLFCHKCREWPDQMGPKSISMLENARKMGLVLQICNISRDIITDSETLGRCYIPNNYLKNGELKHLMEKRPNNIPNMELKKYSERMLDIADGLASEAMHAINLLPAECQRGVLSALEAYQGIGKLIRSNAKYERRTTLTKMEKIVIVFKCMYVINVPL
ncbi:Bifunctional lycopene cyclase/phytoene synthase [Pseudolycoriella hygida]|uniref:Bifunctional lycopene cyclase/phytoene synthase n=1 Tax=Pseudolycoriella hygida TaxID=35572 RepID=A0A9Q0MQ49_9DIPT|nr:Bifunctional lycopene cyclase/phytoene synthase [Pseudolycoriella hygida]